jgi:branched-chain amino acid transport system permease protein
MSFLDMLLQQGINGLMLGIMYSLVAVGFTLYFGVLNVINFAHGDFFMLGSFMALIMVEIAKSLGWINNSIAYILFLFGGSMILTSIIGVLSARLVVKPVLKAPMLISLLVTLGLGIAMREAVRVLFPRGSDPKGFPALFPDGGFQVGGILIRYENIIILAVGILAIVAVNLIINKTKIGSAIRAVAQDSEAAMMMGVNMERTIDITFIIGSAVAAVAGILNGIYYGQVMFNMGGIAGVIGFSAAVIGGLGNVYGAIVGGVLFGLLETLSGAFLPIGTENKRVFAFLVVILFLIFKPTGILGEKTFERV